MHFTLFSAATDADPSTQELDIPNFLAAFFDPPELINDVTELPEAQRKKVKAEGVSWSAALFNGARSKANFVSAHCVVWDVDGPNKSGVDLEPLLAELERMQVSYAVHSTFSSGFAAPKHKLRIIIPTEREISYSEYLALWDSCAEKFDADKACRNPERLHFAPRIPAEHKEHYFVRVEAQRPLWKVLTAARDLNDVDARSQSKDWLFELRTCENKNDTLIRAAFRLGKTAALAGHSLDRGLVDAWAKCKTALEQNTVSAPVVDWKAAEDTCRRGVRNGFKAAQEEADPLPAPAEKSLDRKACDKADRDLQKFAKQLRNTPTLKLLGRNAYLMGAHIAAGAVDEESVRAALLKAVYSQGNIAAADAEGELTKSLEAGKLHKKDNQENWRKELTIDEKGKYPASDKNIAAVLEHHPECVDLLYFDIRTNTCMLKFMPPWECDAESFPAEINVDTSVNPVMCWLAGVLKSDPSARATKDGLVHTATRTRVDRFLDYLEGLQWDGVTRLGTWLARYVAAEENDYTRAVGRKWLIGAVARTFVPGCKMDAMLLLTGPQGVGKSTTFATLVPFPELFADNLPSVEDKDCMIALNKLAIVEMAELAHMRKHDIEKIKQFITSGGGDVRAAYQRMALRYPRRAVLGGTTNVPVDFLDDPSGARRFWVVEVLGQCDTAALRADRDQLWAEAVAAYRRGEQWHLSQEEELPARVVQSTLIRRDELADRLVMYAESGIPEKLIGRNPQDPGPYIEVLEDQLKEGNIPQFFTITQVCTLCELDLRRDQGRASSLLIAAGFARKRRKQMREGKFTLYLPTRGPVLDRGG